MQYILQPVGIKDATFWDDIEFPFTDFISLYLRIAKSIHFIMSIAMHCLIRIKQNVIDCLTYAKLSVEEIFFEYRYDDNRDYIFHGILIFDHLHIYM